ncbi:TauD/TfdA family dioxygenase [Herbaspirillum sp. YR522]|uniref:TauD/TfdA family dioxygenase n=1 Tax=Herbaspirillum sp. YR522 TaxID=1144342 RepID=UPI00026FBC54|nr:TauD/TfdA family dioxygenase [Herbaspirillum sp. YR522]EJN02696.1 Taurine catabolism dioxygenase TauD, TfdA family [Herbaspirillum sp. YR522]
MNEASRMEWKFDQSMLQPIAGPCCWNGKEMLADGAWRRQLTRTEIDALVRAARQQRSAGGAIEGFHAERFNIHELKQVLAWMAAQLEDGRGMVRLGGLPVDEIDEDDQKRIFWGLCANLGTPVYQTAAGEIVGYVQDTTGGKDLTYGGPGPVKTARTIARSRGALRFHTDKVDLLCLMCSSNGIDGGHSKIASSVAIHNEIGRRRPDLLRELYQPYWRMRPTDEEGERSDNVFAMPVFARGPDGKFTSQYSRTYIEQAQEVPTVPRLTAAQNEALDLLNEVAEELHLQLPFAAGEMQFMNQHVTYHGRTAFVDDVSSGARRVLTRIWLATAFSRALPPGHATQWGDSRGGTLRGGAMPGKAAFTEAAMS